MHTYLIPYLWLLKKIYNMQYTSHVKLFSIIKEENDLMKSSFEGRREHFVNLQIKNGETSNYKHGLFCTQTCFCSVSSLTTVTGILIIRLWMHLSKTFFSHYQQFSDRMSICWLESSGWLSGCDQDFEPDQKDLRLQFSVLVPSRSWITHQEKHLLPKYFYGLKTASKRGHSHLQELITTTETVILKRPVWLGVVILRSFL